MKLISLILIVTLFSCKNKSRADEVPLVTVDSLVIVQPIHAYYDTVLNGIERDMAIKDSIIFSLQSVQTNKKLVDSLRNALYAANFKLERVKFYLNICLKNPTQDKFLKGWLVRAVK